MSAGPAGKEATAPVPRTSTPVAVTGLLLSLAVLAAGVVLVHDGLRGVGAFGGPTWVEPVLTGRAHLLPSGAATAIAVLVAVAGLLMVLLALRPSSSRGVRLTSASGVWLAHRDLGRLATQAARRCDGVLEAQAQASGRRVRVQARVTGPDVAPALQRVVQESLSRTEKPVKVAVRAQPAGTDAGQDAQVAR